MPIDEIPGRAVATRRAAADITRAAVLGSYGVSGFEAGLIEQAKAAIAGRIPGIRVAIADGRLSIQVNLRVAAGLPVAEVARQVDSAIRYAVRRALGREIHELRIRIGGLATAVGTTPAPQPRRGGTANSDRADSGTDVA